MSRYSNRSKITNISSVYSELRKKRGVRFIEHYTSPIMKHPTVAERARLNLIPHVWTTGDRFYKIANQYYGDSSLWWIIAWFNTAPTEAHLPVGDVIHIPTPLSRVYDILGY